MSPTRARIHARQLVCTAALGVIAVVIATGIGSGAPDARAQPATPRADGGARRARTTKARSVVPRRPARDAGADAARTDGATDAATQASPDAGTEPFDTDAGAVARTDGAASPTIASTPPAEPPDASRAAPPEVAADAYRPDASMDAAASALDASVVATAAAPPDAGATHPTAAVLDAATTVALDAATTVAPTASPAASRDAGAAPVRTSHDAAAAATRAPDASPFVVVVVAPPSPVGGGGGEGAPAPTPAQPSVRDLLPSFPRAGFFGVVALLLGLGVVLASTAGARWARRALPDRGLLPRALEGVHLLLRLLAAAVVLLLVAALFPPWMGPALPWVLLAAAAALGWSARDVLPDLIAGVVIRVERRVRRGLWVSGEGFAGTVEHVGLRATTLRDPDGHDVALPNRSLLRGALVVEPFPRPRVLLRVRGSVAPPEVRRALHDAILLSPLVRLDVAPEVVHDATDPDVWHVRVRLVDPRYVRRFESELLERLTEILAVAAGADVHVGGPTL
ncbi:MAG: mechanosensitive ion channel [Deltaproteobacteria bacterium]|nr:mechanosensitive ion channel [Deltaproteobacteria bacterium]